jgi:hypothetical protein
MPIILASGAEQPTEIKKNNKRLKNHELKKTFNLRKFISKKGFLRRA